MYRVLKEKVLLPLHMADSLVHKGMGLRHAVRVIQPDVFEKWLGRFAKTEAWIHIFEGMKKRQICLSRVDIKTIMGSMRKHRAAEYAKMVVEYAISKDKDIYQDSNIVRHFLATLKDSKYEQYMEYLQKIIKYAKDHGATATLVSAFIQDSKHDIAIQHALEASVWDNELLDHALEACKHLKDVDKAWEAVDKALESGLVPTENNMVLLIDVHTASKEGDIQRVVELLKAQKMTVNFAIANNLAVYFASRGQFDVAWNIHNQLVGKDSEARVAVLGLYISCEQGDKDKAVEYFTMLGDMDKVETANFSMMAELSVWTRSREILDVIDKVMGQVGYISKDSKLIQMVKAAIHFKDEERVRKYQGLLPAKKAGEVAELLKQAGMSHLLCMELDQPRHHWRGYKKRRY